MNASEPMCRATMLLSGKVDRSKGESRLGRHTYGSSPFSQGQKKGGNGQVRAGACTERIKESKRLLESATLNKTLCLTKTNVACTIDIAV